MDQGAFGFSSTLLNQHMGYQGRPLACRNASREELKAYCNALRERHKGAIEIAMTRQIGVMDDPYHSIQRLFAVDVAADPIAVFGASGRGKSTFIKSLVLALAAQHSPRDLHFYAIDFGRGGLRSLRNVPHCGAVIDAGASPASRQRLTMAWSRTRECSLTRGWRFVPSWITASRRSAGSFASHGRLTAPTETIRVSFTSVRGLARSLNLRLT